MEADFKKFKIEPLEDSQGIYGLEFQNTVCGWFGDQDRYLFLVRPDVVASASGHFLTPELFHTLPLKNAGWCDKTTEQYLLKISAQTILSERGINTQQGPAGYENSQDFWKKFWGFRSVAQQLLNSRLNKVYSGALPENYLLLIRRYPIKFRKSLFIALCRNGERAWQLAETFPALACHIFLMIRDKSAEEHLSAMVREGAKLREIACAVNIPMSFRRFHPANLKNLFSKAKNILSKHPELIDSHSPAKVPKVKAWLEAISIAYEKTGNIDFAKWTARNAMKLGHYREVPGMIQDISDFVKAGEANALIRQIDPNQYSLIAKLQDLKGSVSFSFRNDQSLFQEDPLIHRPFNPRQAPHTLKALSDEWHEGVSKIEAEKVQFPEPWYSGGQVKEYLIAPIVDYVELSAAARKFRNCAGSYSKNIANGVCFLYTVSNGKKEVAMFELSHGSPPKISQIKGPCNSKVDSKARRIIMQWLREKIKAEGKGLQPKLERWLCELFGLV